jgi:hypothetical protein
MDVETSAEVIAVGTIIESIRIEGSVGELSNIPIE